jgi:hypothetical protein
MRKLHRSREERPLFLTIVVKSAINMTRKAKLVTLLSGQSVIARERFLSQTRKQNRGYETLPVHLSITSWLSGKEWTRRRM